MSPAADKTLAVHLPRPPERILIIKLSSIGDVVHSLPVAAALRRRFPQAHIYWLVGAAAQDLVSGNPHLTGTLVRGANSGVSEDGCRTRRFSSPGSLLAWLRRQDFDLSLDLQGLARTSLLAFLSGARWRLGYRHLHEGAFLLCNLRLVPDRKDIHAVEGYLGFVRALGAIAHPLDFSLTWSAEVEGHVEALLLEEDLSPGQSLVALVPGAAWPSKRWPAEHFAELAGLIRHRLQVHPIIVGASQDRALGAEIARLSGGAAANLAGRTTLKELAALLARCQAVVGNDTGPIHLAAALDRPVVALFGPTNPVRTGPYGNGHQVLTAQLPCLGCRRPRCSHLSCLQSLSPLRVFSALSQVPAPRRKPRCRFPARAALPRSGS